MMKTPVLITFFNRPDNLATLLSSIADRNDLDFYLASDGPRNQIDKNQIEQCWKLVDLYLPEVNVSKRLMRETNMGCKYAMKENIDWFFTKVNQGIILEDDCIPNSDFFLYTITALKNFESCEEIFGISGSDFIKSCSKEFETTFRLSIFPMVWGWATWASRWNQYQLEIPDAKVLTDNVANRLFGKKSYLEKWYFRNVFRRRFYEVNNNIIDTWDYSLVASMWRNEQKFLQLNGNTIINIGFDTQATHTKGTPPGWVPKSFSNTISKDLNVADYTNLNDLWLVNNVFNCNPKEVVKNIVKGFIRK